MALFASKEAYEPQDVLVIFKEDGTAAIAPVVAVNDERLYAESAESNYSVPAADVKSYTGPRGRIFLYPTTVENVTDCQRIAALERSTVLRQITHFAPESPVAAKLPMGRIVIIALVVLVLIIMMVAK
ncbi:hypothetical protein QYF52_25610 [Paenibacillus polymyxa]|uniref:hypothetical protein n=1 Tax=Paenibacillus polymyxa TaxID=1406 RepID=UPI0025B63530|nr:hypothetical protein [Paenibacillus polymyxa]MDN4081306.1 hypothetical protein [Paenibacillus polymyxa]MDN4116948.1 hypothetical protein [Paenibacillus polymyxa]